MIHSSLAGLLPWCVQSAGRSSCLDTHGHLSEERVCSQMQQQLPQQQQLGPQVEEVPQHVQQRATRGGGPIVEEPDEGVCRAVVIPVGFGALRS